MAAPRNRGPVAALVVVMALALVIGAVYFFFIRDDSDDSKKATDPPTPLAPKTFAYTNIPFTFTFPGNFSLVDPPPQGFIWLAGIGPYDIIDVKRLSLEERTLAATRTSVRQSLGARPGVTILGDGTETFGGEKMVRFNVDTVVEGQTLHSTLYYFSLGGDSWQLECQSTDTGRAEITAACTQAMTTFAAK